MKELKEKVNYLKNTMMSVSTGGGRIQDANEAYQKDYQQVSIDLKKLGLKNPNPFSDLWEWYGKWSSGGMPQYKDRRAFLVEMYKELLVKLDNYDTGIELEVELSGWERIERSLGEMRFRLGEAETEEQFQSVGLLCRETIISLAQVIYNPELHLSVDGVKPSETDSKRMLDSYIAANLGGSENEGLRRYAKATNALANELTHKRTASIKMAKLCGSSTINLVNLFRILEEE